jgi:hypothetical protein
VAATEESVLHPLLLRELGNHLWTDATDCRALRAICSAARVDDWRAFGFRVAETMLDERGHCVYSEHYPLAVSDGWWRLTIVVRPKPMRQAGTDPWRPLSAPLPALVVPPALPRERYDLRTDLTLRMVKPQSELGLMRELMNAASRLCSNRTGPRSQTMDLAYLGRNLQNGTTEYVAVATIPDPRSSRGTVVAGFIALCTAAAVPRVCQPWELYVDVACGDPDVRGIGRALLSYVCGVAVYNGYQALRLHSIRDVVRTWTQYGFRPRETWLDHTGQCVYSEQDDSVLKQDRTLQRLTKILHRDPIPRDAASRAYDDVSLPTPQRQWRPIDLTLL